MTDIKFIGTTQVELVNSLDESNKISPTQVGENFIEFSFNTLSKNSNDFYHFVITGSNVQVSGTIDSVTTDYQFFSLFSGCSQITDASQLELTAPTMKFFCFGNMFKDCTNLINPPSLEATTLADWCYQGMFAGCSKMTSAPQLPATTLAPYCYYAMFYGCSSLTSAPYLPASTLVDWCYNSMFFNCQSLTSISADFIDWNTSGNSTKNWVTGIETVGEFYNDNVDELYGVDEIPQKWNPDYFFLPLTFIGKAASNAVQLNKHNSPDAVELKYNKNNTGWTDYTIGDVIELNQNDKVEISGNNDHFSKDHDNNYYQFIMTGNIEAKGNIQSLMNYSNTLTYGCYYALFQGCSGLIKAPNLLATTLAPYCYQEMFRHCRLLTSTPSLPATTLADRCYYDMFDGCWALSSASSLPATTLFYGCYDNMFRGCSSLLSAPQLPAMNLANYCYNAMFMDCTTLTAAPELPATGLALACYNGMFNKCTSLTSAPTLPATTLALNCYYGMFYGCSNLTNIEVAFTEWRDDLNATKLWLNSVAVNGTFTKPASLSAEYGTSRIPQNWTAVNK